VGGLWSVAKGMQTLARVVYWLLFARARFMGAGFWGLRALCAFLPAAHDMLFVCRFADIQQFQSLVRPLPPVLMGLAGCGCLSCSRLAGARACCTTGRAVAEGGSCISCSCTCRRVGCHSLLRVLRTCVGRNS
jgi:hypothetical protein